MKSENNQKLNNIKHVPFLVAFLDSRGKKKYRLVNTSLVAFLNNRGYALYNGQVIRINENIAVIVEPKEVFQAITTYIKKYGNKSQYEAFSRQGEISLMKNKAVLLMLNRCTYKKLSSTKSKAYILFKNGVLKLRKEKKPKLISYCKINGFVWKENIIQRDYEKVFFKKAVFYKFTKKVSDNKQQHFTIVSAIGYLLHSYKNPRLPICVIFNDMNLRDEGYSQGGTGKGLIIDAISRFKNTVIINGKATDFRNDKFVFGIITHKTEIFVIDDPRKNFALEDIFSVLTSPITPVKRFKQLPPIPYCESPKFAATTNFTLKGSTASSKRRRYDVFLKNHYSDKFTPFDDFGHIFFDDWTKKEWQLFDNFMIYCLQKYLNNGFAKKDDRLLSLKMLKNEAGIDFIELMNSKYSELNLRYYKADLRDDLIQINNSRYGFLINHKSMLKRWIELYAELIKTHVKNGRESKGTYFEFQLD